MTTLTENSAETVRSDALWGWNNTPQDDDNVDPATLELRAVKKLLEENDGYYEFLALFDTAGNLLNARICNTKYGQAWQIFDADDTNRMYVTDWFNPSKDKNLHRRAEKNRAKGYYVGKTSEKAYAFIHTEVERYSGVKHSTVIVRRDTHNPGDVVIVDNGFKVQ